MWHLPHIWPLISTPGRDADTAVVLVEPHLGHDGAGAEGIVVSMPRSFVACWTYDCMQFV